MKRRSFIKSASVATAGLSITGKTLVANISAPDIQHRIHIFSKCLQFLNYEELAETIAELGFDGADLTVRPGGQVLPENVKTDLPKVFKSLKNNGIGTNMITTAINDPGAQSTKMILKTMADLGIRYYRMGYLNYDDNKTVMQNLEEHKKTFEQFEKLNREYGVSGNYQNHSGTRVGGPVWDLYHLLKNRDPEFIGVQYDVRHATVEGANSWPIGMELISPWIGTTDIKDFVWNKDSGGKWNVKNVPLGEGMVDFNKYFKLYKSFNIQAPVSIHYEYDLGGAEHGDKNPTMSKEDIFRWLKIDLDFLKKQLNEHSL